MKIVEINNTDLPGARFNGHDLQIALNLAGFEAKQFVFEKVGQDPNTINIADEPGDEALRQLCMETERKLSIHALLYPFGRKILNHHDFQSADVVHCHLIHNYFMSLYDFVEITQQKPTIWTIHDPWAFTGHCIYPMECTKWKTGCGDCAHFDRYFPIKKDTTTSMWNIKRELFPRMDVDIVVASKFMYNMVKESPITRHIERVHTIPFGVDETLFSANHDKNYIRKSFSIPADDFVIFFRADLSEFKGFKYIDAMLDALKPSKRVTILTVGQPGLLIKYKSKYRVIDHDWVNDETLMSQLYAVSDLFLMPSTAEAFGVMAIEAMMSKLPIIVFEGTSLPDVTFAPECGIVIPNRDIGIFTQTVERLIADPSECEQRGQLSRELALKHYKIKDYFARICSLYEQVGDARRRE